MGRQVNHMIIVFTALIGLVVIMIVTIMNGDYSDLRRELYFRDHSKLSFGYFLGYLPTEYHEQYIEKVIDASENYELISITQRKIHNGLRHYALLKSMKGQCDEKFLIDSDSMSLHFHDRSNWLTSIVNIKLLNIYLKDKNIEKRNEIIESFLLLISGFGELQYLPIKDEQSLNDFFNENEDHGFLNIHHENDFNVDFENNNYYEFLNWGVFEIRIEIENGQITTIDDRNIFLYATL